MPNSGASKARLVITAITLEHRTVATYDIDSLYDYRARRPRIDRALRDALRRVPLGHLRHRRRRTGAPGLGVPSGGSGLSAGVAADTRVPL